MRSKIGLSPRNLTMKIGGGVCIAAGLTTVWMPIPTGLILMAVGGTLLIASSPTIAAWARLLRRRNERLDAHLSRAEPYLPKQMRIVLAKTKRIRALPDDAKLS
ncbi:MAG: hypothetical protein AAF405_01625 [Pseudomonadota bacterium]